ncbi:cysteine-rich DPF motif domain-containing protein 1 [Anopheles bellator]|uniref:cysteine-rich DPF motif domain-containing protein 1 n=1 Tax=Anopheles bellator TaxID=139047 RepID=UPI0026493DAD|nr:cysteine-rich DPF motif domain-containing protein 1 [Anopheles bellator]
MTSKAPVMATAGAESSNATSSAATDVASIAFRCGLCDLSEQCDYHGRRPPFAGKLIELAEECYVMRDPFAPPPHAVPDKPPCEYFLVLGADCHLCRQPVCKAPDCSFFYGATFCRRCCHERIQDFPLEVRSKIKKQFS